jgi:twitching motility protein PilT
MVVAIELMICTAGIRSLIRDGKYHQIPNAIYTGSKFGMITMENSLQSLIDRQLVQSDFLAKENADLPDLETLTHTPVPHKRRAK